MCFEFLYGKCNISVWKLVSATVHRMKNKKGNCAIVCYKVRIARY